MVLTVAATGTAQIHALKDLFGVRPHRPITYVLLPKCELKQLPTTARLMRDVILQAVPTGATRVSKAMSGERRSRTITYVLLHRPASRQLLITAKLETVLRAEPRQRQNGSQKAVQ
jgi:hypothetical protein